METARKEMKEKRREILLEITRQDANRCGKCSEKGQSSTVSKAKCDCKAAKEIRKLGLSLDKVLKKGKAERLDGLFKSFNGSMKTETYLQIRELGILDKEIHQKAGIPFDILMGWKRNNGLMKTGAHLPSRQQEKGN